VRTVLQLKRQNLLRKIIQGQGGKKGSGGDGKKENRITGTPSKGGKKTGARFSPVFQTPAREILKKTSLRAGKIQQLKGSCVQAIEH